MLLRTAKVWSWCMCAAHHETELVLLLDCAPVHLLGPPHHELICCTFLVLSGLCCFSSLLFMVFWFGLVWGSRLWDYNTLQLLLPPCSITLLGFKRPSPLLLTSNNNSLHEQGMGAHP